MLEPFSSVSGIPNLQLVTKTVPHKRPDTLRVEAYLDKSAPTVEANVAIVQNMVNCAKIRRILDQVGSRSRGFRSRSRVHVIPRWTKKSEFVRTHVDYHKHSKAPTCAVMPPLGKCYFSISTKDFNVYVRMYSEFHFSSYPDSFGRKIYFCK